MANTEYQLAIKIAGMVEKSLTDSCNLTKKQLRGIAKEAADASRSSISFADAMSNAGSGIDSLWGGATKVVKTTAAALAAAGAAAGAAGALAINAGSDFESAFAGVIKTVDATDRELADLEEGLRGMAKNMPMTAVELAGIAEAAGQLGIATENIEDFTKTMADLSVATNLTSEDAASQLAKFANITNMSQTEFDRLGSSVVALGNNFATTEADIVSMSMRLAGAGAQVGMSEADIMGMSAALSSVGIEAEAGGSAMSKVMINMQLAVEKGEDAWSDMRKVADMAGTSLEQVISTVNVGGKGLGNLGAKTGYTAKELKNMAKQAKEAEGDLESWANVANMSSAEFVKAFRDDAAGAISKFIVGLSDTERLGKSAILSLDEMDIKEVRLRDTLLRGANAGELFADALQMANEAFEENTALAKEAEQRYRTFESRVDMVKNRVTDFGISMYQEFREPLGDVIDMILDGTENITLFDQAAMQDLAKGFQSSIPTIVRNLKEAKNAVAEFAQPFVAVGDWMIEHPDVIAGTLAGIGTTIGALKLAQTLTATATAVKAFSTAMMSNPITMGIGLAALAGGAVVGLSAKIKIANAELKKQKLDESFGDITLSMKELEETARFILGEESLQKFGLAMEEIGKVSSIADDINRSSGALQKLTWKIGLGMELSEADRGTFQSSIDSMIENSLSLVEQAQYTANVSVNALFDEGDETGAELIAGFNSLYDGIHDEVKILGRRLGAAYRYAMEDGMISIEEAELIQRLQSQLARVTEQVAQSQLEAKLERIKLQYSGKDLDAETFKNLQSEIQAQLVEASASANQAFEYELGSLKLQLDRSQGGEIDPGDAAYLTQEVYDQLKSQLGTQFQGKLMELEAEGLRFQTETIADAFSESLDSILPGMGENLDTAMQETLRKYRADLVNGQTWTYEDIAQWLDIDGLDKTTKAVLSDLWVSMEPQFNELLSLKKQYEQSGKEIPESIQNGINDAAAIGILAGSQEAMWQLLGETAKTSEEYQQALKEIQDAGKWIPEEVAAGIEGNTAAMELGVERLYTDTNSYLNKRFDVFTVNPSVEFNFSSANANVPVNVLAQPNKVTKHAAGGIMNTPHFGLVAEAGPEAIIPLDGSQNAVSIWEEAGDRLGLLSSSASETSTIVTGGAQDNSSQIVFSPTINVTSGDENSVRQGMEEAFVQFERLMAKYQRTRKRLDY